MKNLSYLFFILICLSTCNPAAENQENTEAPAPVSDTEKAINKVVTDVYDVIGVIDGQVPDLDAIRAHFTTDAVFKNFRHDTLQNYGIDQFIGGYENAIQSGQLQDFREVEINGYTEYFGKVAHRISSYASYFGGAEEPGERGINSFQLINLDGKWLVSAVIWDIEKEGQAIPEKYDSAE